MVFGPAGNLRLWDLGGPENPRNHGQPLWERAISEFRIVAAQWSYLELAWLGGCFLVQPVLQDEPRRSNGVWRPSLAEHRPKTGTNHNSELPMNR